MPLFKRDLLIEDRPVLIDRREEEETKEDSGEITRVEVLGEGGGPVVHGIEFQPDSYEVVAASNMIATLATNETSGEVFEEVFKNSAVQLFDLVEDGSEVGGVVSIAEASDIAALDTDLDKFDFNEPEDINEVVEEGDDEDIEESVEDADEEVEGDGE